MKRAWHQQVKRVPKERRTLAKTGQVYDSGAESRRAAHLLSLYEMNEIVHLREQVPFPLILPDGEPVRHSRGTMKYTADFVYFEPATTFTDATGQRWRAFAPVVEDVKGHMGPVEKLRIAVVEAIYKIKVRITK